MRCIFFTMLAFAVLICGCSIKTTKQTFSENADWLETSIEYPVFSHCDEFNGNIANYVLTDYQRFKSEQKAQWQKLDEENTEFGTQYATPQFGYIVNAEKTLVSKDYISVLLNLWTYTGGAHGNSQYKSFTCTKKGKAPLNIEDLGITYNWVSEQCRTYLEAHLPKADTSQEYLVRRTQWINEGTRPSKENFRTFTYDGATLTIYFEPYQVAPYSDGMQAVEIALSR